MPMNVARLQEYIDLYDVDLAASWVAMDGKIISGLGMLGVRGRRSWITRVGVLPVGRRQGTGRAIVNGLLDSAERRNCTEVWIEVIAGNVPAQQLFLTSGFQPIRELLVTRRPPAHTSPLSEQSLNKHSRMQIMELDRPQILSLLRQRRERANWLNETESLCQAGHLRGLSVSLEGGGHGWVVYQAGEFQLAHVVVEVLEGDQEIVTTATLQALHNSHLTQDAVMENLPAGSPYWPGFQSVGYFEVFRRLELVRRAPQP
jgi:N-acetylglutamate synthase-like GNAT family acetyltransferase